MIVAAGTAAPLASVIVPAMLAVDCAATGTCSIPKAADIRMATPIAPRVNRSYLVIVLPVSHV